MKFASISLIAFALLAAGCGNSVSKTCKQFCEKSDECGDLIGSVEDCREECADELDDVDAECRDAMFDASDCYNDVTCEEYASGTECISETVAIVSECPEILETNCCGSTDTCDWANDEFCDCGGEQAWDAADCATN
jgi:hypothetical protein